MSMAADLMRGNRWIIGAVLTFALLPQMPVPAQPLQPPPEEALAQLMSEPAVSIDVARAALLVDQGVHPEVDVDRYMNKVKALGDELRREMGQGAAAGQQLRVMGEAIYGRWGFADAERQPAEVFVGFHEVLDKQQWNCFGLSVLYLALGQQLGLPLKMVSGRGHVLVQYAGAPECYVETTQGGEVHDNKDYLLDYLPFPCLKTSEYVPLDARQTVAVLMSQTALALQHQDRWEPAARYFQGALKFDSTLAEAHAGMGFVHAHAGRAEEAAKAFREAIRCDPDFREAYGGLGSLLFATGALSAALEAYQQAVTLCPHEPVAVYNLAQILHETGDHPKAVETFRQYVSLMPEDVDGHLGLGLALEDSGNLDAAREAYETALKKAPDNTDAQLNLGYVLERQQRSTEAEAAYRAVLKRVPEHPLAWAGLGRLATARGDFEAATTALDRALRADPENATLYLDLGNMLRAQGKKDQAIAAYRKAITLDPADLEAYQAASELLGSGSM